MEVSHRTGSKVTTEKRTTESNELRIFLTTENGFCGLTGFCPPVKNEGIHRARFCIPKT
jgi:hypothetical protein